MNCPRCGLPQELCVCDEMTRVGQKIKVRTDRRRYGKYVTVVSGFENVDVGKIAKDLKGRLACGGTAKKDTVELQGNHVSRVKDVLVDMGFSEDMIDVA
ncbi:MAG: stress response translation initiation inhibitor YciH [Candidatus Altiarchaeales archaeon]|nr:stress response translation initiation inhibitor YciH [Candidatus Altiarchaeales archaeon]MBD3416342.1 stress response translation initiation inhibitor YciH [Candidatus Altiarchaeales archaeon]